MTAPTAVSPQRSFWVVGLPALAGAAAAFVVPGSTSGLATGASVLALGALALLAGHAWALYIVVPSQMSLVGRLSPELLDPFANVLPATMGAVVLLTAVPAFWLAWRAIRRRAFSALARS
jgi:hypothetical protein